MSSTHPLAIHFLLVLSLLGFTSSSHASAPLRHVETTLDSTLTVTVAAPTSPLSPSYTSSAALQASVLNSTNFYRYEHNAAFLHWNTSLAAYAQAYAAKCIWAHSHGPYGENLALGFPDMTTAIDAWGNERDKYDFSSSNPTGFSEATGHFTQLVWKGSTSTGCAAVDCSGKNGLQGVIVVCEYYPAGNVVGENNLWFKQDVQAQINQGQGFSYSAATSGVGGPVQTTSAVDTGSPTNTMGGPPAANTMGAAPGIVGGGGVGQVWWAFAATALALVMAGGMA